jgi:hypothetical protein
MAEIMSERITLAFEGMVKQTEIMAKQLSFIKNIAVSVGLTAIFWQALEPILRPLLTLMRLVFMALFLPLIPLLKPLLRNMADGVKAILQAQKEAKEGGAGPLEQALAGFTESLKYPGLWAPIGFLLAGAILGGLKGLGLAAAIAGVISAAIGIKLTWDLISGDDEATFTNLFKTSLAVGLAALLARVFLGATVGPWVAGTIIAALSLGLSWKVISAGDKLNVAQQLGGSLLAAVAGAVATLIFGGTVTAAVSVGQLIFATVFGISLIYSGQLTLYKGLMEGDFWKAMGGLFKSVLGGALIGFVVGGPMGALIGMGISLVVSLFVEFKALFDKMSLDKAKKQTMSFIDEQGTIHLGSSTSASFGGGSFRAGSGVSRQIGGMISQEGMYNLHRGERIMSATEKAKGGEAPVIVNINIDQPRFKDENDMKTLVRELERKLQTELRRRVSYI